MAWGDYNIARMAGARQSLASAGANKRAGRQSISDALGRLKETLKWRKERMTAEEQAELERNLERELQTMRGTQGMELQGLVGQQSLERLGVTETGLSERQQADLEAAMERLIEEQGFMKGVELPWREKIAAAGRSQQNIGTDFKDPYPIYQQLWTEVMSGNINPETGEITGDKDEILNYFKRLADAYPQHREWLIGVFEEYLYTGQMPGFTQNVFGSEDIYGTYGGSPEAGPPGSMNIKDRITNKPGTTVANTPEENAKIIDDMIRRQLGGQGVSVPQIDIPTLPEIKNDLERIKAKIQPTTTGVAEIAEVNSLLEDLKDEEVQSNFIERYKALKAKWLNK